MAIAVYTVLARAAWWRCSDHTARLPISLRQPCSPSEANETETKSFDRLLSTACDRVAAASSVAPAANTAALRELQSHSTPN
eukprot:3534734-Prymnesium_polylepis.2